MTRCRTAISLGWCPELRGIKPEDAPGIHTRCVLDLDHDEHVGKGLPQFDYQRFHWFTGDRRTYFTDRTDDAAWELP